MAGYNEILSGRFNRMLQKLLSMKGPASLNELGSVLTPSINIFSGAENRYLEGWNRFCLATQVTGVANAGVRLRNPPGSGVLGVIERISVTATTLTDLVIGQGPVGGNLSLVLSGQRLDFRSQNPSGTIVPSSDASAGALSPQIGRVSAPQSTIELVQTENQEFVLAPGDAFQVTGNSATSTFTVWYGWRERPIEDSEKT